MYQFLMHFMIMSYAKRGAFSPISYKLVDMNLSIKSSKCHAFHNNKFITEVKSIISREGSFTRNLQRFCWGFHVNIIWTVRHLKKPAPRGLRWKLEGITIFFACLKLELAHTQFRKKFNISYFKEKKNPILY